MVTNLEDVTTAELVANIKQMLAERRAQFARDYPTSPYNCERCGAGDHPTKEC